MSPALITFYAGTIGLCLGTFLGAWMEARRWREKAKDQPRIESGGRLYHVVEHGDLAKLVDVLEWPEHASARTRRPGDAPTRDDLCKCGHPWRMHWTEVTSSGDVRMCGRCLCRVDAEGAS